MYSDSLATLYKAGDVIAGRYRIVKVLGAGGMGVVLAARHQDLDTLVAIKLLRPEVLSNRDVVARFAAEARAAVRIKSEHVARVTDVNTLPDGAPYMVMEYLEGSDLAALVEQRGPLSVEDAVDYVLQACEALTEAHCLGIVHRDLKPGNLFLSLRADGSEIVKVLDFGISKSLDGGAGGAGASLTGTGAILGSPTYMSPEQLSNSKTVDRRTDIWAIGVILHQILSGQLPFKADTLPELFMAIVQNQPPPLRAVRPDVPPGLAAVVLRCLEKDRARRFESVGELAVALAPFAPQRSRISIERILRMTPVAMTDSLAAQTATQGADGPAWHFQSRPGGADTQGTWGQTASPPRSAPQKFLIAFAVLAVLVGAGVAVRTYLLPADSVATVASAPVEPSVHAAVVTPAASNQPNEVTREPPPALVEAAPPLDVASDPPPLAQVQATPTRAPPVTAGRVPGRTPRTPSRHGETAAPATQPSEPSTVTAPPPPPATSTPRAAPSPSPAPLPKPRSDWEEDRR